MDEVREMLLLTSTSNFLLMIFESRSLPQFISLYASFCPSFFFFGLSSKVWLNEFLFGVSEGDFGR